jgi:hypothetical protein
MRKSARYYARTAMGMPCGLLSPKGAIRDFHVPLTEVRRLRRLLLAGRHWGHEGGWSNRCSRLRCHFGSSVKAISACSR